MSKTYPLKLAGKTVEARITGVTDPDIYLLLVDRGEDFVIIEAANEIALLENIEVAFDKTKQLFIVKYGKTSRVFCHGDEFIIKGMKVLSRF